jgi:hypothetical protein
VSWSSHSAGRAVRDDARLRSTEKLVAYTLITRADRDTARWTWSQARIARDADLGRSTVKAAIRKLARFAVISIRARTVDGSNERDCNEYRIEVGWQVGQEMPHVGQEMPHGGAGPDRQVGQDLPEGGAGAGQITALSTAPSSLPREMAPPAPLTLSGEPTMAPVKVPKARAKVPKHTPEQIALKDRIVQAFIAGVKLAKGIEPKLAHAGEHAAAFALAKAYGADEVCGIVTRATADPFVLSSNCTLRYIASKADSWRGTAPAPVRAPRPGAPLIQRDSDWVGP